MTPEELAEWPHTPASLEEALTELKKDHAFLLEGDVFTEDVVDAWIDYKIENEVDLLKLRPHPSSSSSTATTSSTGGAW